MYFLVYIPLYLLSLLPLRMLYVLSDVLAFIFFRVFGYRRKVIEENLRIAFPDKSEGERIRIARKFHRNFTDSFIETLKCLSVPKSFYDRHCKADFSIFNRLAVENKSCQMHACHQFNWEWINIHWSIHLKQPLVIVYMPISNKTIDKLFYNMRTKFGTVLLPATNMRNALVAWRKRTHCMALIADQKPALPEASNWLYLFNRPTAFLKGPEKNAVLKKCAVVFGRTIKPARGKYEAILELACEDASAYKPEEIARMYRDFIENAIRQQPDMYLWSHKRFRFQWDEAYKDRWIDDRPFPR